MSAFTEATATQAARNSHASRNRSNGLKQALELQNLTHRAAISVRIESLVLDACLDQAVVETTRIGQADELVKLASSGAHQLVIVAADKLLPPPGCANPGPPQTRRCGPSESYWKGQIRAPNQERRCPPEIEVREPERGTSAGSGYGATVCQSHAVPVAGIVLA
jgi:hypothetical protein